jgi:ATP-dependent Zn proteases
LIEGEVKKFIQQGYETAFKILTKKKKEGERLAAGSLEYETRTGEEIF